MVLVSILSTLIKLPGYKRSALPSTTPQSFKFLKTPHNRRDLRQQDLDAIAFIRSNSTSSTDTSIALLGHLAVTATAVMPRHSAEWIGVPVDREMVVPGASPGTV